MYRIRPPTGEIINGIIFINYVTSITNITYILDFILKGE